MNPNSQHQRWSLWEYRIYPTAIKRPSYAIVKVNAAKFGRLMFGSVASMRLRCATDERGRLYWEIAVLTEGHPVHEAAYTEWMHRQWKRFATEGFGPCEMHAHARLEAGDWQDGRPADQMIILPGLSIDTTLGG